MSKLLTAAILAMGIWILGAALGTAIIIYHAWTILTLCALYSHPIAWSTALLTTLGLHFALALQRPAQDQQKWTSGLASQFLSPLFYLVVGGFVHHLFF